MSTSSMQGSCAWCDQPIAGVSRSFCSDSHVWLWLEFDGSATRRDAAPAEAWSEPAPS